MEHLPDTGRQAVRLHLQDPAQAPDLLKDPPALVRVDQDPAGPLVIVQPLVEGIDRIAVPDREVALSVALFEAAGIAGGPVTDIRKKGPQHGVGIDALGIDLLPRLIQQGHGGVLVAEMLVPEFRVPDLPAQPGLLHLQVAVPDQGRGDRVADHIDGQEVFIRLLQIAQQALDLAGCPAVADQPARLQQVPDLAEAGPGVALHIFAAAEG